MNQITINGVSYSTSGGSSIIVNNNNVIVDGKIISKGLSGIVEIKFEGDVADFSCDCSATITGNVQGDVECGNSLKCGDIQGNVHAGNSIKCKDVYGVKMKAGNSIKCENKK